MRSALLPLSLLLLHAGCASSEKPLASARAPEDPCARCDLRTVMRDLAGPEALACGTLDVNGPPADRGAVNACVLSAVKRHRPFTALYSRPGSSGTVLFGVAQGASGELAAFTYVKSAPGQPPRCRLELAHGSSDASVLCTEAMPYTPQGE